MSETDKTTIVFTDSKDVTTDVIFQYVPNVSKNIFRFNFDLFDEYQFELTPTDFYIADPLGRVASLSNTKKAYYRKPIKREGKSPLENYAQDEKWAFYRELIYFLWENEKIVLVEPDTHGRRVGKLRQLKLAKDYFDVPDTILSNRAHHSQIKWQESVVKSITGNLVDGKNIFTTLVNIQDLDPRFAWFIQEYINANYDITIVFVRGKIYPYRLKRDFLEHTIDFRAPTNKNLWGKWEFFEIDSDFCQRIINFMQALKLHYGRLDFLVKTDGKIVFCEVNPNGQFAWLDFENEKGLLSTIAAEISPETDVCPIPYSPFT